MIRTLSRSLPSVIALLACLAAQQAAAGDPPNGARIFRRCLVCHTIAAGEPNRLGPNLHGLFERNAGKAPGFDYSDGLAAATFPWDDGKLDKWLEDPESFSPGARMSFGLPDAAERADVIAYLHEAAR
jgi:cytochrome c